MKVTFPLFIDGKSIGEIEYTLKDNGSRFGTITSIRVDHSGVQEEIARHRNGNPDRICLSGGATILDDPTEHFGSLMGMLKQIEDAIAGFSFTVPKLPKRFDYVTLFGLDDRGKVVRKRRKIDPNWGG